jgi:hypothetical protein
VSDSILIDEVDLCDERLALPREAGDDRPLGPREERVRE